jgi:hypothetical protein
MFDSRIFEDNSASNDPNIEFHIHAFLSPNAPSPVAENAPAETNAEADQTAAHQEVGVGPEPIPARP